MEEMDHSWSSMDEERSTYGNENKNAIRVCVKSTKARASHALFGA
jgi:hypothetical protein